MLKCKFVADALQYSIIIITRIRFQRYIFTIILAYRWPQIVVTRKGWSIKFSIKCTFLIFFMEIVNTIYVFRFYRNLLLGCSRKNKLFRAQGHCSLVTRLTWWARPNVRADILPQKFIVGYSKGFEMVAKYSLT